MTIATSRKTSLEINFGAIVTVLYSYPIFFASYSCSVQRKHDFKIELNGRLSVLRPYQVSHVVRNRPSVLLLAWHEWFSCKGIKNTRFIVAGSRCRQNLKYENFTSSFGRLRQKIAPKSVPHVQHDYFASSNQSFHCFPSLSSWFLPNREFKT